MINNSQYYLEIYKLMLNNSQIYINSNQKVGKRRNIFRH